MAIIYNPNKRKFKALFVPKIGTGGTVNPGSTPTPPSFTNTYSLAFDGVDDYINGGNSSDLQITSDISISVWFKTSSTNTMIMVAKRDSPLGGNSYGYQVYCSGGKVIFLVTRSGLTTTSVVGTTTISDGRWHHALCTINQSTQISIVLDGATEGTSSLPAGTFIESGSDLLIGYNQIGAASYYFNGALDEVAIFNSLQSGSVIYNGGVPNDLTSLNPVAWYRNGDNGTWKSPQWLIPNNENKTKFSNYSFLYDGVDDYLDCGNVTTLSNATTFTYSGWYKQSTLDVIAYMFGSYIDASNRVFIYTWSNGLLNFQIEKSGTNYYARFDYSTAVTAGEWFHLAVVYDGSGATNADKVKIYIDGVLMTLSFIGAFPTSTPLGTNLTTIGKVDDAAQTWNGSIDEVAVFNSIVDVATIYNSGVPNDLSSLSLVGYWRSEQSNFTDNWLVDNSALSNYSTRSFAFDGISDYINTGTNSLIGASTLTISAWFKSSDVDWQYLLGDNSIRINIKQSNGDTRISFTGSVDPFRGFGVPYSVGNWNNIILTFDGSLVQADRLKLYHNGVEINNINAGTPNTTLLLNTAANFMIGRAGSTLSNPWNGNIDEVAYWDSVEDASTIYNSGTPARIEGAVSHWKMGEDATFNTNWILPDNGSASNTGTSANMTIADLEGEAPNYTGGGLSNNMTIEDRVGNAPNSSNNAVSFNQVEADRKTDVPT